MTERERTIAQFNDIVQKLGWPVPNEVTVGHLNVGEPDGPVVICGVWADFQFELQPWNNYTLSTKRGYVGCPYYGNPASGKLAPPMSDDELVESVIQMAWRAGIK